MRKFDNFHQLFITKSEEMSRQKAEINGEIRKG